jgi:hypothetical protein
MFTAIKYLVANLTGFFVGIWSAIYVIKYLKGEWFALPLGLVVGMAIGWYLPKFIRRVLFRMDY